MIDRYRRNRWGVSIAISTGNPSLPLWVVSSPDGVNWTSPQELGGGGFSGSSGSNISVAHGVLAATFQATTNAACTYLDALLCRGE